MRLLGAVLAGGRSQRFGSDKAAADWRGQPLIAHVLAALRPQVEAVIVCGRELSDETSVADRPEAGLGPLGGLAGALAYAEQHGFDRVLSVPCDAPLLPRDLPALLGGDGARYLADLPVIGLWPADFAEGLERHLADGGPRSVRRWAETIGGRAVDGGAIANVNRPADLVGLDRAPADEYSSNRQPDRRVGG